YLGGLVKAIGKPGCTGIMATPVPERWDRVAHPSYPEVWERVLGATRDPYDIMRRYADDYAWRPDYVDAYRRHFGFRPVPADFAGEAERLGYLDAWSLEADGIDCFAPLAVVGSVTSMRLGTAIANVFTRGPATLAMCAAGIAEVAPGRFCLGIGAGSQPIVE